MMRTRKSFTRDGGQTIKLPRARRHARINPMVDRHLYSSLECQNRGIPQLRDEKQAEKKKKKSGPPSTRSQVVVPPPKKKAPFREQLGGCHGVSAVLTFGSSSGSSAAPPPYLGSLSFRTPLWSYSRQRRRACTTRSEESTCRGFGC